MQTVFNVLMIFATIELAVLIYEQVRKIYKRYEARKDAEAFLRWANNRLKDHAKKQQQEEKKEEG